MREMDLFNHDCCILGLLVGLLIVRGSNGSQVKYLGSIFIQDFVSPHFANNCDRLPRVFNGRYPATIRRVGSRILSGNDMSILVQQYNDDLFKSTYETK